MAPMEYLEAWGTLIHEKNLKSKISCQTPFKGKHTFGYKSFWLFEGIVMKSSVEGVYEVLGLQAF
jgi:hypothetical protein